jgi:hypothetical protein
MKGKHWLIGALALGLVLALGLGSGLALQPGREAPAEGAVSIWGSVSRKFSYQGLLAENDDLMKGARDMRFRLRFDGV